MRVLMLGWEFPPHISGGLGTACHGLTRGLNTHGVDVCFVVPRAHGDEDETYVRLVGCNELVLGSGGDRAGDSADVPVVAEPRRALVASVNRSFELLAVDSLLGPYLSEEAYQRRAEEYAATHAACEDVAELDEEWATLQNALATNPVFGDLGRRLDDVVRQRRGDKLKFTGRYGPDLMLEVARYAVAVGEVARREDFDVVHAHDWMTYAAGMAASAIADKPLVVHMHASEYDRSGENVNPRIHELECLGLSGAQRVMCVSNYTSRVMQTRYGVPKSKLRVVHNAVEQSSTAVAATTTKAIDEPIVLFLGRVTFQKGPDYFLEAAAKVIAIEPKVKFVMAGSGDMLPDMIERCARLGLAKHMHFTGFLRGADVKRMYAMADCYVMPSVSEPFGISPLEAMAQDVPVIVSKQSGVSEVLRHALKVDFWDVEALANKILAVLRYSALRKGLREEGRAEVRTMRWERPAKLVKDIYAEVAR